MILLATHLQTPETVFAARAFPWPELRVRSRMAWRTPRLAALEVLSSPCSWFSTSSPTASPAPRSRHILPADAFPGIFRGQTLGPRPGWGQTPSKTVRTP